MSYILDALKRADAERERERGAVPDLYAQAAPSLAGAPPARRRPARAGWMLVGSLIGLVLAAAGWWMSVVSSDDTTPPPVPRAGLGAPTGPGPAATPAGSDAPPPADAAAPAPRQDATAQADPDEPPIAVRQVRPRPPQPTPTPTPTTADAAATRSPPADATPTGAAAAADPARRVYQLHELPAAVRGELPQLSFGGAMHSEEARSRMLIVNGQLLREGDAAGPNLRLAEIRLRSAVFDFKGYRVEIAY